MTLSVFLQVGCRVESGLLFLGEQFLREQSNNKVGHVNIWCVGRFTF